jgi:hypothetical protein
MRSHALRTLVKDGNPRAMRLLGFDPEAPVAVSLDMPDQARIGAALSFAVGLEGGAGAPVLVDYVLVTPRANGEMKGKVFKLKQAMLPGSGKLTLKKTHKLKADATTFTLRPGPARLQVMVNGIMRAEAEFVLTQ